MSFLGKWRARVDVANRSSRMLRQSEAGKGEIELSLLGILTRVGSLNVDIGANKGVYTYQLARWGDVVAFEPIPQLASTLNQAAYENVTVHQCVLCEKAGTQTLRVPYHTKKKGALDTPSASLRDQNEDNMLAIEVKAKTLDSFGLEDVGFIKIDVEGWEENVLQGARDMIARTYPVIMAELVDAYAPGVLNRVPSFFDALNYKGFSIDARALRVIPLDEIDHANPVSENYIFVPAHDAAAFQAQCSAHLQRRA
ncbi:FkbM family methyltransferase [Parvibaculaceae bacterium PLY_AMNH_Bact1]|nr:FkbM family methyltransferase [Parvibaculaceae bacterium PLY_AMNH_Bact1]